MARIDFSSDYTEGCHESILHRLLETNSEKTAGYGLDEYSELAKAKILKEIDCPFARVYFLVGGTQTNATVLDSILAPYQGVISAETGHIACHESGAVEASGHKVMTIPHKEGKINPDELEAAFLKYYNDPTKEHTVMPGAVYVSQPTEYGTIYTKSELAKISEITHRYKAKLFVDGARLGYALAARENDLTLPDIAKYADAFYIGGTKVGALFGEAVILTNPEICPAFFTMIKRHGALLAKGRILGIQFDTLFTDGLYFKIAKNAIDTALYLKNSLADLGYEFFLDSPTNQQFVIINDEKLAEIKDKIGFSFWEKTSDGRNVIRLVTSFMTTYEQVDELIKYFQ